LSVAAWTNKAVIESSIPIYCSQTTYDFIAESSPYLIDGHKASGGGSVPAFDWHIMPEDEDWEICGVSVTPLPGMLLLTTFLARNSITR